MNLHLTDEKKNFAVSESRGLTSAEAERSAKLHGTNAIAPKRKTSLLRRWLDGFSDPIIKILIGAMILNVIVSFGNVDIFETAGILVAVLISTVVSAVSEYGSENAFEKLSARAAQEECRVRRDGTVVSLPVSDIVVGDVILLGAGDGVPADARVISGSVFVDQSALNGESRDEKKFPTEHSERETVMSPESVSALLRGSTVTSGTCEAEVMCVGEKTLYGGIAAALCVEKRSSPLKRRLAELASSVSSLGYAAAFLVAFAYLFNEFFISNGMDLSAVKTALSDVKYVVSELLSALTLAISVLVVAVPEGLPMMITVVLSSNMKRMLKDRVLVKKLVGIETAGSLNILFCDKTGTLTCGDFNVTKIITSESEFSSVSRLKSKRPIYEMYLNSCFYNTESVIGRRGVHRCVLGGNGTDRALLETVAEELAVRRINAAAVDRVPFSSKRKWSSVTVNSEGNFRTFVKGAPELILPRSEFCVLDDGSCAVFRGRSAAETKYAEFASHGARVIALAVADGRHSDTENLPDSLAFLALVVISDEPRPEARAAVNEIRGAGVSVVMITGDGRSTATAIARRVGIIDSDRDLILSGEELRRLSDEALAARLRDLRVICRALPSDKERLVRVSEAAGLVVGMTGDGVNDSPALKAADVGFALGSGTEVAREAGDIVILDDNIKSIGKAILYGRTIFDSIRKFIVFQLTMNLCAVGVSILGPFIGIEAPVTVIQMLWVNLIMDTLGGLAFAGEAPRADYMKEPPKRLDERILSLREAAAVFTTGSFAVGMSLFYLKSDFFREMFGYSSDYDRFMTVFFAMFVFCGIFMAFNCRTTRINIFSHLGKNTTFIFIMTATATVQLLIVYFGGEVFRTTPLAARDLASALIFAFFVVPFDVMRKLVFKKHPKK